MVEDKTKVKSENEVVIFIVFIYLLLNEEKSTTAYYTKIIKQGTQFGKLNPHRNNTRFKRGTYYDLSFDPSQFLERKFATLMFWSLNLSLILVLFISLKLLVSSSKVNEDKQY